MSHSAVYAGRESVSTRNPHSAAISPAELTKALAKLSPEERILGQWRAAYGCPVSDEAKAQFCIHAVGRTFRLSDVRLWKEHHPLGKDASNNGTVYLEFFYDGTASELEGHQDEFTKAFEQMIDAQLQERRVVEFRKKLTARRRAGRGVGSASNDLDTAFAGDDVTDQDWRDYLRKPVPPSEFSIRSFREAGCMLLFLVCQTSLSLSASEVLGQIAFQEHFPIDGKPQEPSKSDKPLPRWVYGMAACTAGMTVVTIYAWWQVVRQVALVGGDPSGGSLVAIA
eukprot:CAMPEP_0176044606 /NCGR_PEP_ID=MMETSP0120_2-20121206/22139_1 /TAXON_ID=160619 /ORGANISM="Kryptoperidinium foliaceum, Strain CCMP 1326" /LENGTH=281 /DNA_ID=CAMNT_0017378011 /DNA_START=67 /DNA_END=912 /DNA_ORIENTATION=-